MVCNRLLAKLYSYMNCMYIHACMCIIRCYIYIYIYQFIRTPCMYIYTATLIGVHYLRSLDQSCTYMCIIYITLYSYILLSACFKIASSYAISCAWTHTHHKHAIHLWSPLLAKCSNGLIRIDKTLRPNN